MNWLKKQLTEPTAWLCAIIAVVALFTRGDGWVVTLCIIGILLDEDWIKAQLNSIAPKLSAKLDELFK